MWKEKAKKNMVKYLKVAAVATIFGLVGSVYLLEDVFASNAVPEIEVVKVNDGLAAMNAPQFKDVKADFWGIRFNKLGVICWYYKRI